MSNLETQVPSLNTCLSLVARGIIMDTLFYWVRDEGGRFLVVVRNQVGLGQKAVCGAPRAKELFTALQGVRPDRREEVRWLSLVAEADGAEELAKLLMSELPVDYRHMSVGLLMAMAKARGMQEMTAAPAVTPEEDKALEEAIRTAAAQDGDSAYKASTVDTVAWAFSCIRATWAVWGGPECLMRMMRLQDGREQLTQAGIEEICSPPCIGDNF